MSEATQAFQRPALEMDIPSWFVAQKRFVADYGGQWVIDPKLQLEHRAVVSLEIERLAALRWGDYPAGFTPGNFLVGCQALLVHMTGNVYYNGMARGRFLAEMVGTPKGTGYSGTLLGAVDLWGYISFELAHIPHPGVPNELWLDQERLDTYRTEARILRSLVEEQKGIPR